MADGLISVDDSCGRTQLSSFQSRHVDVAIPCAPRSESKALIFIISMDIGLIFSDPDCTGTAYIDIPRLVLRYARLMKIRSTLKYWLEYSKEIR